MFVKVTKFVPFIDILSDNFIFVLELLFFRKNINIMIDFIFVKHIKPLQLAPTYLCHNNFVFSHGPTLKEGPWSTENYFFVRRKLYLEGRGLI